MKRGLVLSLSALALVVAGTSFAHAQAGVQLSLNLRYTDPADPTEGGQWYLVTKTDDTDGVAAISAYISNINTAGMVYGNGAGPGSAAYAATTSATIGAILNGANPYFATIGTAINVVYGQDTANGPIVADVGQGAGKPGNTASDPLKNAAWNNASIIATGTFGGIRPAFVSAGANSTDSNTLAGVTLNVPSPDANTTVVVRGDSLASLALNPNPAAGLKVGDANRDFSTDFADFGVLQANYDANHVNPGNKTWDQGDFNDDGFVDFADFGLLQSVYNQTATAPITAIPEPSTIALAGLSLCGLIAARRRQK